MAAAVTRSVVAPRSRMSVSVQTWPVVMAGGSPVRDGRRAGYAAVPAAGVGDQPAELVRGCRRVWLSTLRPPVLARLLCRCGCALRRRAAGNTRTGLEPGWRVRTPAPAAAAGGRGRGVLPRLLGPGWGPVW